MSCRYRLWRILVLILFNGPTKAQGLDVRHEQHKGNCTVHALLGRSVFVMEQPLTRRSHFMLTYLREVGPSLGVLYLETTKVLDRELDAFGLF